MSNYDSGFDRAQRAYDNATPPGDEPCEGACHHCGAGDDEPCLTDDCPCAEFSRGDEPDPDDARDRQRDAAMASDWDTADVDSGLTGDDWGGPNPLDD